MLRNLEFTVRRLKISLEEIEYFREALTEVSLDQI